MNLLRRIVVLGMFVCLVGSCSVGLARYNYDWRMPQPMASTEAAMTAIRDLRGFVAVDAYTTIRELAVDPLGMQVSAVQGNSEKRFGLTFGQIESFDQMDDSDGRLYSFLSFRSGPSYQSLQIAGQAHGRRLLDAVVTLALAQNAPLLPYHDFQIAVGSAGYLAKVLKQNKVSAGAVVHSGAPNSPLLEDDVIVQATYAGKVYPITGRDSWDAVCREAIAGKAEETVAVRVVRNGVPVDREVKLVSYGAGAKIAQGGQGSQTPPKGFGIQVRMLEAAELKALGLDRATAFLVLSVANGSTAEMMQLRANDVLLAINGVDVVSPQQLIELVSKGPVISIRVWRDGAAVTLQAALTI